MVRVYSIYFFVIGISATLFFFPRCRGSAKRL
jgi:hypothetical protein